MAAGLAEMHPDGISIKQPTSMEQNPGDRPGHSTQKLLGAKRGKDFRG